MHIYVSGQGVGTLVQANGLDVDDVGVAAEGLVPSQFLVKFFVGERIVDAVLGVEHDVFEGFLSLFVDGDGSELLSDELFVGSEVLKESLLVF